MEGFAKISPMRSIGLAWQQMAALNAHQKPLPTENLPPEGAKVIAPEAAIDDETIWGRLTRPQVVPADADFPQFEARGALCNWY
jgi:hypothetical protein